MVECRFEECCVKDGCVSYEGVMYEREDVVEEWEYVEE